MPVLFEAGPGNVVAVPDDTVPATLQYLDIDRNGSGVLDYAKTSCVITGIGLDQQVNAQMTHMFGDTVYAYVFGDRISNLRLDGVGFAAPCDGSGRPGLSGVDGIQDWYRANRFSKRVEPVRILLGAQMYESTIMKMGMKSADPAQGLVAFSIEAFTLPNDDNG